jgi:hypothetical protein
MRELLFYADGQLLEIPMFSCGVKKNAILLKVVAMAIFRNTSKLPSERGSYET